MKGVGRALGFKASDLAELLKLNAGFLALRLHGAHLFGKLISLQHRSMRG